MDVDVGVEVSQLREGGLSARKLSNVILADVKIAAEIGWGDEAGVVEGDLLGSRENQVLCDFNSQLTKMILTPETP
jgi:hypothetical protein